MKTYQGKYSRNIENRIVEAIANGLNQRQASKLVGITEETLSGWKKIHPKLLKRLEATVELSIENSLKVLAKAGQRSWQAEAWRLERLYPALYSPKLTQDITSNQPVIINVDMQGTYKPPQPATGIQPTKTITPN